MVIMDVFPVGQTFLYHNAEIPWLILFIFGNQVLRFGTVIRGLVHTVEIDHVAIRVHFLF